MKKVIQFIIKNLKYIIVVFVFLLITITAIYEFNIKYKGERTTSEIVSTNSISIGENKEIVQTFKLENDNFNGVWIEFDNLGATSKNTNIIIGIKDLETVNIIKEEKLTDSFLRTSTKYRMNIDTIKDSNGKMYSLYIKYIDFNDKENFKIKYNQNDLIPNGVMYLDDKIQNGDLCIQISCLRPKKVILFYAMLIFINIIMIIITVFIFKKKNMKIENVYLVLAVFVYSAFLSFMPTFTNHDETYHWFRAYEVSEGKMLSGKIDGKSASLLPVGVQNVKNAGFLQETYDSVIKSLSVQLNKDKSSECDMSTVAVYSPVQYFPQALGIKISSLITDRVIILTYAGRIFNMLFAIAAIYFTIKLIPFAKNIIFTIAFIPSAIEGFTSLSPDSITLWASLLFIAYILNLLYNKEKEKLLGVDIIIIAILSFVISLCKIVYIPLVLLLLLLLSKKFINKKKEMLKIICIIIVSCIFNFVWLKIASGYLALFRNGDSTIQTLNILHQPVKYLQTLLYTLQVSGDFYFTSLFGQAIGWATIVKLYNIIPYGFFILLLFVSFTDNNIKEHLNKKQMAFVIAISLIIILLVFTSLFVQWTPIASDVIEGVQGRYFLPILPLIFICLGKIKIKYYGKLDVTKINSFAVICFSMITLFSIFIKFI